MATFPKEIKKKYPIVTIMNKLNVNFWIEIGAMFILINQENNDYK